MPRLCKKFNSAFTTLVEELPISLHRDFYDALSEMVKSSSYVIQSRVYEWNSLSIKLEDGRELCVPAVTLDKCE